MNRTIGSYIFGIVSFPLMICAADSQIIRELTTLNEQREKAVATALAPINQKYMTALDQLLKKATQARDEQAIAAIQEALVVASEAAATKGEIKSKINKRSVARKLTDAIWIGDGKHFFGELKFGKDGSVSWVKFGSPNVKSSSPYEVGDDGTVTMNVSGQIHTLKFTSDLTTFTINDSTFKPK